MSARLILFRDRRATARDMLKTWCVFLLGIGMWASPARAQTDEFKVSAAVSEAVMRARTLLESGGSAKARALLDSLVDSAPRGSLDAAEALYWRAQLSESEEGAERDWKRLIVDAPLAPRASEALLRLAELDRIRGSHAQVRQRVTQLLRDHPESTQRLPAMMVMARSYFDERNVGRGCGVVEVVRRDAPLGATEVRLQADELQQQCRGVTAIAMGTPVDSTVVAVAPGNPPATVVTPPATINPTGAANTTSRTLPPTDSATVNRKPPATSEKPESATVVSSATRWAVQLAAFDTRAQATALVQRLGKRAITARVEGNQKPYRVHVGRYATRSEAAAALAALKKKGQSGFVTEARPPAPPKGREK